MRPDGTPAPAKPARRDNEYVRNGTQNLFAALQVHSGEVSGMASKTRNKTQEVEAWLDEHPRWRFHFTPKHASWLNQVEIFFSILQRRLIKHGIFDSEDDLATRCCLRRALQPHSPAV